MVMGSILGDGSDFRQPLAAQRGRKYLNDPALCAFFSRPRAFLPLKYSDGDSFDQQMAFYLREKDTLLGLFNFNTHETFQCRYSLDSLGLKKGKYILKEFLTGTTLAAVDAGQDFFSLTVPPGDAIMAKVIPQ